MTERRVHNILYGQIKVSRRSDDDRILTRSLRHDLHRRIPGAEQFSRPSRARQDNATHARVRDEVLTQRVLADGDKLQDILRDARSPQALGNNGATASSRISRLQNDSRSCSQSGQNATGRNCQREVPRRSNQGQIHRSELGTIEFFEVQSKLCVVVGKVGSFGNLDVSLFQGLAQFGACNLDQIRATTGQLNTCAVQDIATLCGATSRPFLAGVRGCLDEVVQGFAISDRPRFKGRSSQS